MEYNHIDIEKRWQNTWKSNDVFTAKMKEGMEKYYVLEMFPYPSGKLHMGHVRNYSIGDVIARTRRNLGYNVLYPMGWDAFGLPAENAAIKANVHPADWTYKNIDNMREQLQALGYSYDWNREIATCHPGYFKWEQKVFLEMMEKGLAYRKSSFVNWCNECATVLANEQVENGQCWRCSSDVEQKELVQWFFKITDYSEELLNDLEKLKEGWPEKVLTMQKNWIGRSEGVLVHFDLEEEINNTKVLDIFTTRPDTLFGVTFMSLAAEHPLALLLSKGTDREKEVEQFVKKVRNEDKINRVSDDFEKEGVFTGRYAINPVNGRKVPIYIANFVLMDYGTGAIMAVPAHDQRDFDFAKKYDIPIEVVILGEETPKDGSLLNEAYVDEGKMYNSGDFDGTNNIEGKKKVLEHLIQLGAGETTVNYRLRDWGISRQRYWGSPIPVIHCKKCGIVKVPEKDLPVTLPDDVNWADHTSGSPLAAHPTWKNVKCPSCGGDAVRDTDTMDTFVESSWYYLRYTSPRFDEKIFNKKEADYWMGVDQYIGGIEHAVMHLLYARFFTKVLRDLGYVSIDEPFNRLLTQGMVTMETYRCDEHEWLFPTEVTKEGNCVHCGKKVKIGRVEKMSKSKKNVVDPMKYIEKYGADTVRFFMLSDSPPERDLEWSDSAVEGSSKFVNKVWRVVTDFISEHPEIKGECNNSSIRKTAHKSIKKITHDIKRFHFNTAIAEIRVLFNELSGFKPKTDSEIADYAEAVKFGIQLISPFTPHMAEELWKMMGEKSLIATAPWPAWNEELLVENSFLLVVQVNGKVREKLNVPVDYSKEEIEKLVLSNEKIQGYTADKTVRKFIYIPGRLANVVVS